MAGGHEYSNAAVVPKRGLRIRLPGSGRLRSLSNGHSALTVPRIWVQQSLVLPVSSVQQNHTISLTDPVPSYMVLFTKDTTQAQAALYRKPLKRSDQRAILGC